VKLDRILIAWNGSAEAGRAIQDSFAMLERAQHVGIIQFAKSEVSAHDTDNLTRYLMQHDIDATTKLEIGVANVGEHLLRHASDQNYDLVILGAYGRTRLREIIMGGVTRQVLESSKGLVIVSH
jgi:nucleotide-binding universal stress UspA family protein